MNSAVVGIVGAGLIGGSIALRARASGATVIAFDRDPAVLARARERGAIDLVAASAAEAAERSDTLVVALPVDATRVTLSELAAANLSGSQLTLDVASVKAAIAAAPVPKNFVGTHPMAGRERGGIDAADAALFAGATWAFVPSSQPELDGRARAFITSMGAVPLAIEAGLHDEIVALTSHLPQAVSVLLAARLAAAGSVHAQVRELCGPGMMSMLRLARSPESMWEPIVAANARPLASQLHALAELLTSAAQGLDQGDISALMSYFGDARRAAQALEERFSTANRSLPDE